MMLSDRKNVGLIAVNCNTLLFRLGDWRRGQFDNGKCRGAPWHVSTAFWEFGFVGRQ